MANEPLPDYSDYAYEHRPPPGSFRDWLQKHSVQRIGLWLFLLGVTPFGIYAVIYDSPVNREYFCFMDYLLIFWFFACGASAATLQALKGIIPGIVTVYGRWARVIGGFMALIGWGLALLFLYLGIHHLLSGG